jgi:hypothetical protein
LTDTPHQSEKTRIKVPADVARIMSKWGGQSVRLAAARGALPMSGPNLVMVLMVFYHGEDPQLKEEALATLQSLPAKILLAALAQTDLHPAVIDLIVRLRHDDAQVMEAVIGHPMTGIKSLLYLAKNSSGVILDMLAVNDQLLARVDLLRQALINNPNTDRATRVRLGWSAPPDEAAANHPSNPATAAAATGKDQKTAPDAAAVDELADADGAFSKYQQMQEMTVNEKIKMALTGDKEWRTLLVREANKQISSAVLRNPRITEAEALAVAQNRSSSEELIRIILLNRDWVKIYDMKKALVFHPRTPLQQAMRLMNFLSERDLKEISTSRNVTQPIINNARRILMTKKP